MASVGRSGARPGLDGQAVVEQPLPANLASLADFRGLYLLNSVFGAVAVRCLDGLELPVDDTLATICDPLDTLE